MRRAVAFVALVAVACLASAQKATPVTQGELAAATQRIGATLAKTLSLPEPMLPKPTKATAPATRAQVVDRMHALFQWAKPKFRAGIKALPNPKTKPVGLGGSQARAIELARWEIVFTKDYLYVGPAAHLTPDQLGNALGRFLERILDLTHTPIKGHSPETDG